MKNLSKEVLRGLKTFNLNRLVNKVPVIISDNCWAGSIYNFLEIKYFSPLIGTYIYPGSFMGLLKDFPHIFLEPLNFTDSPSHQRRKGEPSYYPIGVLKNDIEIHFLHYSNEQEALQKWNRRTNRMLEVLKGKNNVFIKMDDSNYATINDFQKFHSLNFKNKVSFSKSKVLLCPGHFEIKLKEEWVSAKNTSYNFDLIHWLNTGEAKQTILNKIVRPIYDSAVHV